MSVRRPRVLVIEHEDGCPAAHFGVWLDRAGAELITTRPYLDEAIPELADFDGVVVLGGSMGAHDDHVPWIAPLRDSLRAAADAGQPVLGICLGHQLLAAAYGARSIANPGGQQVGLFDVDWAASARHDALVGDLVTEPRRGVHWNNDVVVELPESAVVLAQTPQGEVQAVRFAPSAWGVQWHPEVDADVLTSWAEGDRDDHLERGIDQQALLAEIDEARVELDHAWEPLASAFVALCRDR